MTDGFGADSLDFSGSLSAVFDGDFAASLSLPTSRYQPREVTLTFPDSARRGCPKCGEQMTGLGMEGVAIDGFDRSQPDGDSVGYRVGMRAALVRALPCRCVLATDPVEAARAAGFEVKGYGDG